MTTERDHEALDAAPQPPPASPAARRRGFGAGTLVAVAVASAALATGAALWFTRASEATDLGPAAEPAGAKEAWQCPMHPTVLQDHPGDCPICGMKLVKVEPPSLKPGDGGGTAPMPAKQTWQCPMHPTIVQDHPGDCPICGMKLVKPQPAGSAPGAAPRASTARRIKLYRSPMDPKVTSPTPRKDEMGMDYLPVYEDEAPGNGSNLAGQATVEIDPARQQLIGLQTAEVTEGQVGRAWRTVGRVAVDETRVRRVNVKVPGYVERVFADFVGKPVRKGEPLLSVYSPELLAAQQEYLLALRTRDALSTGGGPLAPDGDALVTAARRRLELWDIPRAEVDRIAHRGEPSKVLTIYSPVAGVVAKKDVVEGTKLEAGAMPYEVVDLSSVWVLADVYESELRHVKVGMPATMTLKAFPGQEFGGRVQFMDPMLDPATRTVKVRLAFPNPGGALKPEMFGEVVLRAKARSGLRIPQDAVVNSGTRTLVFVALGDGRFQPREVTLGDAAEGRVEVVRGLSGGERVVTRANFLIDSESRLRASLAALAREPAAAAPPESARVLPGADSAPNGAGAQEPDPGRGGTAEHVGASAHGDRQP